MVGWLGCGVVAVAVGWRGGVGGVVLVVVVDWGGVLEWLVWCWWFVG